MKHCTLFLTIGLTFVLSAAVDAQTHGASAYLKDSQSRFFKMLGDRLSFDGQRIAAMRSTTGDVVIFARSGSSWVEEGLIPMPAERVFFGDDVLSISGDTVAIGAPGDDQSGEDAGAIYLFTRDAAGAWSQAAKLRSPLGAAGKNFGRAVAIDGATLVAGDKGNGYVFTRTGSAWSDGLALGGTKSGDFGKQVAVSGDRVVVTASGGSYAEVFRSQGGVWNLEQRLLPTDGATGDFFGVDVSIDGERLVVGAYGEDSDARGVGGDPKNNNSSDSGAAYVFEHNSASGDWEQTAYLKPVTPTIRDRSGWSVAISGTTVVVGAPYEDSNATTVNGDAANDEIVDSGSAQIYEKIGAAWVPRDYLKPPNPGGGDRFGSRVAIGGTTVVVASPRESSSSRTINAGLELDDASASGAVYVFTPGGKLPEIGDVLPEVEFSGYDPDAPRVRLIEGDFGSSAPLAISRTATADPLTVRFRLSPSSQIEPGEISIGGGGPTNPELKFANGIYSVTLPAGVARASYRVGAVRDASDQAEPEESIIFEFVDSAEDYTINARTGRAEFSIRPQGLLVTNTSNAGQGSLRQAVENANQINSSSVIKFSSGASGSTNFRDGTSRTIALTETITTLQSITLEGPGKDLLAVSGSSNGDFAATAGECRPFVLDRTNVIFGRLVVFRDLTIKDGVGGFEKDPLKPDFDRPFGSTEHLGGLVFSVAGSVSFVARNCRFSGGRAFEGGAIYAGMVRCDLIECDFVGNQALYEGGAVAGSATVTDSSMIFNRAGNRGGGFLGAVLSADATSAQIWSSLFKSDQG